MRVRNPRFRNRLAIQGGNMAALPQPAPGGAPLDPAAELRATLAARVKLEELWQKYQADTTAAQDQALTAVTAAPTFADFSGQMDKIIQAEKDFQAKKAAKEAEADWLDAHGVYLIKNNHKVAEAVEKELGKSSQLKWYEDWEKKSKMAAARVAPAPKAAAGKAPRRPKP
jgi:hypothetical protein